MAKTFFRTFIEAPIETKDQNTEKKRKETRGRKKKKVDQVSFCFIEFVESFAIADRFTAKSSVINITHLITLGLFQESEIPDFLVEPEVQKAKKIQMRLQKKQEAKQRKQARLEKSKVDFQNPKLLLAKVVESKV